MASLGQLQTDVLNWLNRQDPAATGAFASWVTLVELEIAQTLRARCQVKSAFQTIDTAYIALPSDFASMESIRDAMTGEELELKDAWSGHWESPYVPNGWQLYNLAVSNTSRPTTAYRLVGNCIEFLPHPWIPDPPDPNYVFQQVLMGWYAKPTPLLTPTDSNTILEELYPVYLYGCLKHGAIWALDDARAQQMDALWQKAVTQADLHKQQSDYSGAPLAAEMAAVF